MLLRREGAPDELPVRRSVPAPRIVSEDAEDYNEHNTHRCAEGMCTYTMHRQMLRQPCRSSGKLLQPTC